MNFSWLKVYLVLFLVAFDFSANAVPSWRIWRKVHIRVVNHTNRPMYLHCFSLSDDFGFYNLIPNDVFDAPFTTAFYPSRHYCEVRDLRKQVQTTFTVYDIWDSKLLNEYCGGFRICEWILKDGGVWIHNLKTGTYHLGSNWVRSSNAQPQQQRRSVREAADTTLAQKPPSRFTSTTTRIVPPLNIETNNTLITDSTDYEIAKRSLRSSSSRQ
ncbi:hypothetical protein ACFE04_008919 [Oxalis oulophora]